MKKENPNDEFLKDVYPILFEKRIDLDTKPPEGYFQNLSDRVMDKIHALPESENKASAKIFELVNFRNIAIAAAAAIFLALTPYFKTIFNSETPALHSNDNDAYPENDLIDLDSYAAEVELYDAYAAEGLSAVLNTRNLTDDEIIEYLNLEGYSDDLILENI